MEQIILLEGLRQVREIIKNGWTQGVYARDNKGTPCPCNSTRAKYFCLSGAILRVADQQSTLYSQLFDHIMSCALRNYYANIPIFNDSSTQEEVLEAIDYTIKQVQDGYDFLK